MRGSADRRYDERGAHVYTPDLFFVRQGSGTPLIEIFRSGAACAERVAADPLIRLL
ncbi:MAG: hypothetical protein J4G12_05400 [Gemmatimonadetes bacterium]|nr:hypothetical protein [Gemmatimonadota bacterium]